MTASQRNHFDERDVFAAGAIALFALALRGLGLRFGLPWLHHWDEGWVVDNAAHMLQTRDWRPRVYQYGAPLSLLMGLTIRELGVHVPNHVFDPSDAPMMTLIGRIITALISASGAFAIYVAARFAMVGDRTARTRAIYASLAYATAAELVSHGRYAVTDACLVALVAWSLACGALYVRGREVRWALGSIVFASLAAAFKITGAPAIVIPFALLFLRPFAARRRTIALMVIPIATAIFFICNPHVLIHSRTAVRDIAVRINQYNAGGVPEFLVRNAGPDHLAAAVWLLIAYVFHRWPIASAIMASLAFGGVVRALRNRSLVCVVGVLHAAIVVVGISLSSRAFLVRNYLIAAPVLCIGFGFAMEAIHHRISSRAMRLAIASAFAFFFVIVPLNQAIRAEQLSADARMRAMDWIAEHAHTPVVVACNPDVGTDATGTHDELHNVLTRPNVTIQSDFVSVEQAADSHADFLVITSHPDPFGERGDIWPFVSVPGYRNVAEVDSNPYEHNYALTPTWMGRFNAIVLERQ